jgi:hypothetical protein
VEEAAGERVQAAPSLESTTTLPYPPSWFDRVTAWVERLPGPAAAWYAGFAVGWWLLLSASKWADGSYPVGYVALYHLVFVATPVYTLAVMHWLDHVAGRALTDFRPVLAADAATAAHLRYRLTTLPALPALLVTLFGAAGLVLTWTEFGNSAPAGISMGTSPLAFALETSIQAGAWALAGLFIYHTVHQLRVVNDIYAYDTRINLFTLGPLYAFSRLTALTAVAPIPVFSLDYAGWPGAGQEPIEPATLALWATFGLLSVVTFVLPLLGVHRLLEQEKQRMQLDSAARLQALLADIHVQAERRTFDDAPATAATKNLLDSLLAEQALLNKVSTWPWSPETPRAVGTALLLPVLLLVIDQLVQRLFGH